MPYITNERRSIIDRNSGFPHGPVAGDYVYYYYKLMVKQWKEHPRFETAYEILIDSSLLTCCYNSFFLPKVLYNNRHHYDLTCLVHMAWEEFRERYLKPYEAKKLKENGDVL